MNEAAVNTIDECLERLTAHDVEVSTSNRLDVVWPLMHESMCLSKLLKVIFYREAGFSEP